METTVYQSNISIFHKSLDLLISSILIINNNIRLIFPSFLFKMYVRLGELQFRIRKRRAQTTAEDANLMTKALHVLPTF